jgi:hypothetical protein
MVRRLGLQRNKDAELQVVPRINSQFSVDQSRAFSNSDRVPDQDHSRPAGSEIALQDQRPRPRCVDAQHFE